MVCQRQYAKRWACRARLSATPAGSQCENGLVSTLVWIGVMLTTASARAVPSLEDGLADRRGTDTADQFLRLADGELDRAYRLAGLILGDQYEAEDATQDALLRAWRAAASLRDPAGF